MKVHWTVPVALSVIIVLLLLFQPSTPPNTSREDAYRQHIGELRVDSARSAARIDSLVKSHIVRQEETKVAVESKDREIKALKDQVTRNRARIPVETRNEFPAIDSTLNAYDALVDTLEAKNDLLQGALYDAGKEFSGLLEQVAIDKRISAQMISAAELRMEEMRQDFENKEKKLRRTNKLLKVAAVLSFGLGVILAK